MYVPPYRQSLEKAFQKERDDKKNRRGLEEATSEHEPLLVPTVITNRPEGTTYTRYFARFISTREIFEITAGQYRVAREDKDYKFLEIEWDSTFPKLTKSIGGYLQLGSNYTNYLTILKHRVDYPEIYDIVSDDSTFFNTPYTPGGEFKDRQGKSYAGSYTLTKTAEVFSLPDREGNQERKKLYLIDKILTEFDR
jgi:hypothetical protein